MEETELFRYTRESIQAGSGGQAFSDMNLKSRERALQQEMRSENNLHPALCTPDGHYKVQVNAPPPYLSSATNVPQGWEVGGKHLSSFAH